MTNTANSAIEAWLTGRIPTDWAAVAPPSIVIDREEITVTITVEAPVLADDASDADRAESVAGRVTGFREDTRVINGSVSHAMPSTGSSARSRGRSRSAITPNSSRTSQSR